MPNPFRPTFGISPYVIAGRSKELRSFELGLFDGVGSMYRMLLLSGPRGVGKTVLVNECENVAKGHGWIVVRAHAHDQLVADLRDSTIPHILRGLDYGEPETKRKISGVSIAGLGSVTTESVADGRKPYEVTLLSQLRALLELVQTHGAGVLITVDELQAAPIDQLAELAIAIQDVVRDGYNIAFVAAGLTFGVDEILEEAGTTFLRRARRIELGPVDDESTIDSLQKTAESAGKKLERDAAEYAATVAQGYPYLIQLVGSLAWAEAGIQGSDVISMNHVMAIEDEAIDILGEQVHKIALKRLPDGERGLLQVMALLQAETPGPVSTAEVAQLMGKSPNGISVWRRNLIERDLISSPAYGKLDFTLPYLGTFLRKY